MTPEEQRIAIAEFCGWKWYRKPHTPLFVWREGKVPDYLNDLNAMHEVESKLNQSQAKLYDQHLKKITGISLAWSINEWTWHATAAQRAEALLKTIGKWKESKQ